LEITDPNYQLTWSPHTRTPWWVQSQQMFTMAAVGPQIWHFRQKKNYVVKAQNAIRLFCNGCFFKFGVEVGIELSIVNALHRLRITDQLFKSYVFTRVVRSQSTLQRLLRRQI
jgi:hypothetical protein